MAARSQFVRLQKAVRANCSMKDVLLQNARSSCLSYQQRRHRKSYPRQKPQSEPWHLKQEPDPVLFDPLTEESKEILEDELVKQHMQTSPLRNEPWPRNEWNTETRRCGVLAVKIGAQPLWKKDGTRIKTVLLQIVDNHVIKYIPPEEYQTYPGFNPKWLPTRNNWGAAVVGAISSNPLNLHPDYVNIFTKVGLPPKRRLTRFLVTPDAAPAPGTPLNVTHFKVGDYVDCSARTIDHGFQGVMKRWGFSGMPASHGSTKTHRRPGTLSSGRKAGLWKGTKLPGLMGDRWRVAKGMKIWRINTKYNVMYVSLGVPGPLHCFVRVYDSSLAKHIDKRSQNPESMAMPTCYPDDLDRPLPENIYDDEIFHFDDKSITFAEES